MTRCPQCGRPAWQSHGGMGGHLPPDDPGVCWPRGSHECRLVADARMRGIREGVQTAITAQRTVTIAVNGRRSLSDLTALLYVKRFLTRGNKHEKARRTYEVQPRNW